MASGDVSALRPDASSMESDVMRVQRFMHDPVEIHVKPQQTSSAVILTW